MATASPAGYPGGPAVCRPTRKETSMPKQRFHSVPLLLAAAGLAGLRCAAAAEEPFHRAELVFPLHPKHNHAPGIAECPNGDLLVSWYRGSGERQADDVAVFGARKKAGESKWSEAFLLADNPGFPDGNTALY